MFSVSWDEMPQVTSLPDAFIMGPMKDAPGEYVKIYIYLMMMCHKKDIEASVENLCRVFCSKEQEIVSALKYWQDQKMLELYSRNGYINGIKLTISPSEKVNKEHRLNNSRVQTLVKTNTEAQQLLFVAEQYFGRPLSAIETGTLLYFLDELHFSFDLCDYLMQYCIGKGHTGIKYIEKVALAWHSNGYKTVEDAKNNTYNWSKIHFDVLKAFGISNRNPIPKEIEYIDKWYKEYGFTLDIIAEACTITLSTIQRQSYEYADGILTRWHDQGVKTLNDIEKLNEEYKQKGQTNLKQPVPSSNNKNQFHNFQQRADDLDELERKLDRQFAQYQ